MASSITQAREGTLYLMVGGDEDVFKKVEPILRHMSAALRHVGGTGQAAKVKALVNMVMNINTAGLAEGLGLGDALGLDLTMLREVFSQTGANSRVLETDGEDMQNREHSCFFSAAHAAKDSGIALESGAAPPGSTCRSPRPPRLSTTGWCPRASANSTNPASQSSRFAVEEKRPDFATTSADLASCRLLAWRACPGTSVFLRRALHQNAWRVALSRQNGTSPKNIVAAVPLGHRGDSCFRPCRYPYRPSLEIFPFNPERRLVHYWCMANDFFHEGSFL